MIQAAVLDYVRVLDNMRTLVAADVAPRGCWVITVPSQSDRGVPARMVLAGLWLQATFNTETRLALAFEEMSEAEGRVVMLVGLRRR